MIIIDTDSKYLSNGVINKLHTFLFSVLDISLTLEVYKTSETDGEMVVSVCKDKQIPWNYYGVRVMIASVMVENATITEDLPIPDSDPYSPNRAS